ncbi:uncharacterized protein IWZ02DRAFT_16581 [Phyllosticta citriasiana]|uniref:uncharacterized protein n=1 Tax=Phyllosticta citriasiana TaxID=595635 RepID=UPI0030FD21FA
MRRRRTMMTRRGDERKDAGIKDPKETDDIEIISANQTSPSIPRSLLHTLPGFLAAPHQRAGQAEPGWPGQRCTLHCAAPKRLQGPLYERNALLHARASGNSGHQQDDEGRCERPPRRLWNLTGQNSNAPWFIVLSPFASAPQDVEREKKKKEKKTGLWHDAHARPKVREPPRCARAARLFCFSFHSLLVLNIDQPNHPRWISDAGVAPRCLQAFLHPSIAK